MTEKQLINQLKSLREIKPRTEWVVFNKKELFKKDRITLGAIIKELQIGEKFVFQHKMVFAPVLVVVVLVGLFGFALNSVPGDSLFALKKITEQSQAVFITDTYKSIHNFEMAGKRLDDLTKIAQDNQVKKIAPALVEYSQTISEATKTLSKAVDPEEVAIEIKKLHDKEEKVRSLGIELDNNKDLDNALPQVVERWISDLEKQGNVTEDQLAGIKQDYDAGDYWLALEKLWELSNDPPKADEPAEEAGK
jgi:Domain of unknown function (DUF5667)